MTKNDAMREKNDVLRQLLIDEEGCELEAYKDSEDIWTIAIGHNLETDQTEEELSILGLDDELEDWEGFAITEAQAFELFDLDVEEAINDLYPAFTSEDIARLNATRYAVLVSMVFQMGGAGVRKFKNFVKAVKTEDWDTAALEMIYANPKVKRHSKWYLQTPDRCQRAADAMRTGSFEGYRDDAEGAATRAAPTEALRAYASTELLQELIRRENRQ